MTQKEPLQTGYPFHQSHALAPRQLDPPIVGKVTYHTIELYWPPIAEEREEIVYCVQEQDIEENGSFVTVYEGTELHCTCTGLRESTSYQYRLRGTNSIGSGLWSPIVKVSTTRNSGSSDQLHKAINNDDIDTVRSILDINPQYLEIPDTKNCSPLMHACKRGRKKIVELLLSLGADTEYSNTSGKTSMMEACCRGYNDCVMLLRNAGSSWTHRDTSGLSILHWAVEGEQSETIELLLSEGFPIDDMDETTISGWTPLLRLAATHGNTTIARQLIYHGADINRKDSQCQTPLMLACLGGHRDLVNLLLSNNCDWKAKNKYNKSALDFSISFGREEIVDLIKTAAGIKTEHQTEH